MDLYTSKIEQNIRKDVNEKRNIILLIVIYSLFFIGSTLNIVFFNFIGFIFLLYVVVRFNSRDIFLAVIFLVPSIGIVALQPRTVSLLGVIIVLGLLKRMTSKSESSKIHYTIILSCFILVSLGLVRIIELKAIFDFLLLFKLSTLLVFLYLISKNASIKYKKKCIDYFLYGTVLMVIGSLIYTSIINSNFGRFSAIYSDSNYTAVTIGISISLIVNRIGNSKNNLVNIGFILFLSIAGLMTGSRNFIAIMIFIVAVVIFDLLFTSNRNKKKLILLMTVMAILIFLPIPILEDYKIYIVQKIINPINGDISSGRIDIWGFYVKLIFSNISIFLFGIGIDNYHLRLGFESVAHNGIIASITTLGLIGTLCIIIPYVKIYKVGKVSSSGKRRISFPMSIITLGTIFIAYSTLDGIGNTIMSISIMLSSFSISNNS